MTFRLPGLCLTTRAIMVLAMLAVGLAVLLAGALPASAQGAEPQRVPDAPDKPTGQAIYAGMVDLEWDDLPDATSYDVQFFQNGAWLDLPGNGIEIAFYGAGAILRNLPEEGVYYFQVRARNALGPSAWSEYLFMQATTVHNWDDVPEPTNTAATGAPTISGKAEVSETLAASISDIEDENGLDRVKFSYQWTSGDGTADSDIEGATGATYTLRSDDAGKAIKVRVSFTDRGGYAESLTSSPIKVDGEAEAQADNEAPTVSSIAITSDPDENDAGLGAYSTGRNSQSSNWASGVYRIGDDVQATVTFNENVTVTGSPQLELAIGSGNRTAEYEGTDGSAAVFSYTVAEGDSDTDGISIGANKLTLNSGSIKDAADNDANLSHNALTDQDDHKVDGIRPRIARFFLAPSTGGSDGAYSEGEEMIIVAEFTEDHPRGSVTGPPQVKLDFDGAERMARWDISLRFNAPLDYGMFGYVVQEGDLDSDGVAVSANSIDLNGGFIRDPAGNDAVLTHSAVAASSSFIVDAVAPTVSSIAITSDPGDDDTYGTGDKIEATVTFSENMTLPISPTCGADVVHCKAELELDIGGTARTADYQSHAGADVVFAYTVQAGDTDDNGISIGANKLTGQLIRDAAGRNGEGINDADLSHDAVADDAGHKVSGASSSLTLSGDTTIRYAENGEGSVATYRLSGSDGTITWTLSGDDSDDFSLAGESATRRELSFTSSPNYEEPTDADTDNRYDVTIRASDGANTSTLQVTVIVTNVRHDADELPIITGTARVGEALTIDTSPIPDTDQDTTFGYQWIRTDGDTDTNIDGATSSSYTLTANDEGKSIKVLVGFRTTGGELVRLTSAPTEVTVSEPEPDLVVIGIDASDNIVTGGSFRVGVTVTNQGDAQSAATTLRWKQLVDGTTTEIGTDAIRALNLHQADFETIRLTAPSAPGTSYYWACVDSVAGESDTTNNCSGSVTVTVTNNLATGAPTISGTAQVGETLTVDTSGIADADGLSGATFSYQWMSSRDTEIQGATDSTYTLQAADAGKTIKARVSFTDDAGNEETLTSEGTAAVAEPPASGPAVAIGLSPSGSVDEGTEIALTMSFSNLESDSDTSDTDYIFRADVVNADACEGGGMGKDRYMYKVDEEPEVRTGTVSASCAPGDYTVQVSISSPGNVELASATADFTVAAPGQQQQPEPPASTDATLSGLSLSGVNIGAFDPATTGYTASVANDVDETTVTPTTNDEGATYAIKLSGVAYADGTVSLTVGANVITIEVTAADGNTAKTYTVTITRAAPPSTDATLSGLALTGVDIGAFDSATTGYAASVANGVDETTVTPTTTDDGATYVVKLGGVTDDDSVIPLAVGKNVITIKVTAEDGQTSKTYTITVTRAAPPAPGPAVAVELSPSGSVDEGTEIALTMSFANLESNSDTSDTDYIFRADVVDADACEGGGMGKDRYMYKVDEEPEVRTGTVSASCAPGDYTVQVSISSPGNVELASATADFTVAAPGQQQQPEPPASTDATLSGLSLSGVNIGAFDPATTGYTASVANDVTETTVTATTSDDGATYVIKLDGAADADGVVPLAVGENVISVEVTAEDGNAFNTYTVTVIREEPAAVPPDTPDTPSGELTGPGTASLGWNDVPTATSYDVRFWLVKADGFVELSPDAPVHGISIAFNGSSAAISGLSTTEHDGWYAFQVRAVNAGGASEWSGNNRIPVPKAPQIPKAPQKLRPQATDDGVVLMWDAPAGEVESYQILRHRPQECEKTLLVYVADTGDAETTYTDGDVDRGVRYVYRVKAINAQGVGAQSNFATLTYRSANTADRGAPNVPRNLDGVMTREGIRLEWDAPGGGSKVTGYQILRRRPQECEKAFRILVENTGNTDTVFVDDDYEIGTKYVYRVKAVNGNGVGKWSNHTVVEGGEVQIMMIVGKGYSRIKPGSSTEMTIALSHLRKDDDESTIDYVLRGDATRVVNGKVTDMDACEGDNLGTDINIRVVDEVTEQYYATFGGSGCTESGEYTVTLVLTNGSGTEVLRLDLEYELKEVDTVTVE